MSLKEKETEITKKYLEFKDPIFIGNDGDSHDSR